MGVWKRLFSHICQLLVELAIKVTEKGDLAADNRLSSTNCPSHGHMKLKYFDKANMINDAELLKKENEKLWTFLILFVIASLLHDQSFQVRNICQPNEETTESSSSFLGARGYFYKHSSFS